MPCRSDYLEPTHKEKLLQETAILYSYALDALGEEIPDSVLQASNDIYCSVDFVPNLCDLISNMAEDNLNKIVYNARSSMSRKLADWWEKHQEADQQQLAQEASEAAIQAHYERVIMGLSDEDIGVLKQVWGVK